jgi:uridylate kinase
MASDNGSKQAVYKRIILKLSGEALAGPQGYGIDPDCAKKSQKVKAVHNLMCRSRL